MELTAGYKGLSVIISRNGKYSEDSFKYGYICAAFTFRDKMQGGVFMMIFDWKIFDNFEKEHFFQLCIRVTVFAVCMTVLTGNPAQGDVSYILETPSPSSVISSINIKGPLDFCGEQVPLDNQDVRERLEKELIGILWNRPQIILWMKRSGRYMPYIEEMLKQNAMPDDLKYIAIIESSLMPHLGSSKGAKGYWQFMEGTGKTRVGRTGIPPFCGIKWHSSLDNSNFVTIN
jgi:hypothetical protein